MTHSSSTLSVPSSAAMPKHIAIIMDGNGRWATRRFLPRFAGHAKGVDVVRKIVEACADRGIGYLTLFAFSSENWRRPEEEVSLLMRLFVTALEREVGKMHNNGIRLKVVGDLSRFDAKLQDMIVNAERKTANNSNLTLTICANYGGRWDVMQAVKKMLAEGDATTSANFTEDELAQHLAMAYAPEPDLFIRTGGEQRISNFLLWQLAYSEFYFTETYWPDFDDGELDKAIASFQLRERRFGRTSDQIVKKQKAS
ncbi:polyprenyl diphosphate synthase [Glaciimonas immobilis]|uniref:Isoprenyl transferase n=1 Tax=Glaciimonas immobilis TaxID=728004 RepID=A0A840RYX3_9BURK|nr:polyprenyl diphosphate synthase [Glaciimonas immobilis]KAF3996260.1 di-trans,poly-cis-decaprenylcistransferase [Glaciimonas immobilis]MBB5202328.1 undecaprenyl diphosphate synthase [Glaciimonas immobilis]